MGDDDACTPFHQLIQSILDGILRDGIQCGSGFIQNQNGRIFQDDPGYRNALFLTAGKLQPTVTDLSIISVRLAGNKLVNAGNPACPFNLLIGCIRFGIEQVFFDCSVKQIGFLGNNTDVVTQVFQIYGFYVIGTDFYSPAVYIVKTGKQIDNGRFSRA